MNKIKKVVALSLLLSCIFTSVTPADGDWAKALGFMGVVVAGCCFTDVPRKISNYLCPEQKIDEQNETSQYDRHEELTKKTEQQAAERKEQLEKQREAEIRAKQEAADLRFSNKIEKLIAEIKNFETNYY